MPRGQRLSYSEGVNLSDPPSMLRPRELALARNCQYLTDSGQLAKTGGRKLLAALGAKAAGLGAVRFRNGDAFLVSAAGSSYYTMPVSGHGGWTARATGLSPVGRLVTAYHSATDRLYVGDGVNPLMAWSGSGNMRTVQITQPAALTTALVTNAATLYTVGSTFSYCVTAYNDTYDSQSPPSAVSVVAITTATETVRLNLPSLPSGATKWRIWRTQAGGDIFYLLATVASTVVRYYDGTDTQALGNGSDNTTIWGFASMDDIFLATQEVLPMVGEPLRSNYITVNGTIPIGDIMGVFQDRLYIAGNPTYPHDVYFSTANHPEQFSPVNFFQLGNDLGEHVTAAGVANDRWIGFTPNTAWRMNVFPDVTDPGFALGESRRELITSDLGCVAPRSIANVGVGQPNNRLFCMSSRGPAMTDAYMMIPLGKDLAWSRNLVNFGQLAGAVAVNYPRYAQIRLYVASPHSATNDVCFIYHYHPSAVKPTTGIGPWLLPQHVRCQAAALSYDVDREPQLFVADTDDTGNVYVEDSGDTDDQHYDDTTGAIDWEWMTGDNALGEESQNKRVCRVFVNVVGATTFAPVLRVAVNKSDQESDVVLGNLTQNTPGGLKFGTSIIDRDKTRTYVGGIWQTASHHRLRMREVAIGARQIGTVEAEIEAFGRQR